MGIDSDSGDQADGNEVNVTSAEQELEKFVAVWKVLLSHNTEELYADDQQACCSDGLGGSGTSDTLVWRCGGGRLI